MSNTDVRAWQATQEALDREYEDEVEAAYEALCQTVDQWVGVIADGATHIYDVIECCQPHVPSWVRCDALYDALEDLVVLPADDRILLRAERRERVWTVRIERVWSWVIEGGAVGRHADLDRALSIACAEATRRRTA